jgi:hypothetical protein
VTGPASDEGRAATAAAHTEPLYVVRVHDRVDAEIAGHRGASYASPPQPRDDALALIALLVGATTAANGAAVWTRAIAGGQRTITLAPAANVA